MALRERIRGVLGFPVTHFRKDLSLDLEALAGKVDQMARRPFRGLVAGGGTGELDSLTPQEVEQVVRVTVEAVHGRMPVVAGAGYSAAIAADMARRSETTLTFWGMPAGPVRPPLTNCLARDIADLRALMEVYADVLNRKAAYA